jgi:UDP:flavonoid glycosyltransferase YjiC (YdhE family)
VRALITTIPQYGHFRPLVPLAEALMDAGHVVAVASAESFRPVATDAGFELIAAGVDQREALELRRRRHPDLGELSAAERSQRVIPDFFVGIYAPALLADAERLLAWQPDIVIREEGEFAGAVLAALSGVPCVDHGWGPLRPRDQVEAAARALVPIWRSAGLEPSPSGGAYEWLYLDPCPASLQFSQVQDIANRQAIRPSAPRASAPRAQRPPGWLERLGDRVVYITLGTVSAFTSDVDFLQIAIDALQGEDVEVVLTVGPQGDPAALGDQPGSVHIERFVPQADVLPHCLLAVTNGGSGSTLGALSAGVPLLIVPGGIAPSQTRNAQAVSAAGVGRTVSRSDATVGRLRGEMRALLGDTSYRSAAERIAAEIGAMPTPARAVDVIENLTATRLRAGRLTE